MSDLNDVDCRLAVTDSPIAGLPYMIRCREAAHRDTEQSMAVYSGTLHCYGCSMHISRRMDTLAYLLYGRFDKDTVYGLIKNKELLQKYTFAAVDGYRQRVSEEMSTKPLPKAFAQVYETMLQTTRKDRLSWYHKRGLSDTWIHTAHLGHAGTAFVIPVYDACNRLVTFRYRHDDELCGSADYTDRPVPKYYGYSGRNAPYLYPLQLLSLLQPQQVYVVEGELDALRLWQEGIPAVTVTNGGGNLQKIPQMLKLHCDSVRTVVLIGDMDERGRVACESCYSVCKAVGYPTSRIEWPLQQGKDITEYLKTREINHLCEMTLTPTQMSLLSTWTRKLG